MSDLNLSTTPPPLSPSKRSHFTRRRMLQEKHENHPTSRRIRFSSDMREEQSNHHFDGSPFRDNNHNNNYNNNNNSYNYNNNNNNIYNNKNQSYNNTNNYHLHHHHHLVQNQSSSFNDNQRFDRNNTSSLPPVSSEHLNRSQSTSSIRKPILPSNDHKNQPFASRSRQSSNSKDHHSYQDPVGQVVPLKHRVISEKQHRCHRDSSDFDMRYFSKSSNSQTKNEIGSFTKRLNVLFRSDSNTSNDDDDWLAPWQEQRDKMYNRKTISDEVDEVLQSIDQWRGSSTPNLPPPTKTKPRETRSQKTRKKKIKPRLTNKQKVEQTIGEYLSNPSKKRDLDMKIRDYKDEPNKQESPRLK